jgi:hypothetical protein
MFSYRGFVKNYALWNSIKVTQVAVKLQMTILELINTKYPGYKYIDLYDTSPMLLLLFWWWGLSVLQPLRLIVLSLQWSSVINLQRCCTPSGVRDLR